jgi:ElaB/YqjD/DUF883 family membrane-anchored ribosome-binding protein
MQQEQSSGSMATDIKDQATDMKDQATEVISARTSDAVEQGRGAVQRQVGQRSAQLGDQIGAASHTIRQVAEQARREGNDQQARLADEAAKRAERVSTYLGDVDPDRLMADAEEFTRRQPWLVAGVGLIAGFALARSLKASSGRRSTRRYAPATRPAYGDASLQPSVYQAHEMTSAVPEFSRES